MALKRQSIKIKAGCLSVLSGTNKFISISKNGVIRMSKESYTVKKRTKPDKQSK
jgi:hypothetical protein